MQLTPRHNAILELARKQGQVLVDDLAAAFEVTPQTVRKDLNDLCRARMLRRIHGGALYPSGVENMEYEARRRIAAHEKEAIGRAAAEIIPDGASLFINIGTTTEAVSQALVDHDNLMVITNNINVANTLRVHASIEVVVAGGVVRPSDGGSSAKPPLISSGSSRSITRSSEPRPWTKTGRCSISISAK